MAKDQLPNPQSRPQIPVEEGFRHPAWKGFPPWKGRGGDTSLQRPTEHLEVPGAPPSPLNVPEDAGSPQRHPAHLEVQAYPKTSPKKT